MTTPVGIPETFRFFGPYVADKIEAAQAQGAPADVVDLYLVCLLLADDDGELNVTGLEPMYDWLLANGVMSWKRVDGNEGILTFVEWSPP
jgi:hypothetical protein